MIIFPAIDLRKGKCVRLTQGRPDTETVFSDDPAVMALRWEMAGARWLHVVNLDGALAGTLHAGGDLGDLPINLQVLHDIVHTVHIPVQFGGGMRTWNDVELILDLGAARVILGTAALQRPELISETIARFGAARIGVGLDARDGKIATHGWQKTSEVGVAELGCEMRRRGVEWAVYTDISRDGMLTGVNALATAALARETGLQVIASGGVASLDDVRAVKQTEADGVVGMIIGKALYTGAVDLATAIQIAET